MVAKYGKSVITNVYVEQYGFWWKLSVEEWREICKGAANGEGHSLPENRALKRRSPLIAVADFGGNSRKSFFAKVPGILIVSPLDWYPRDYQSSLSELDAHQKDT